MRLAVQARRLDEGTPRLQQVFVHRGGGRVAVARSERRVDALQATQHDLAHGWVAERQRADVLQVVGVDLDHAHEPGVGHPLEPRAAVAHVRVAKRIRVAGAVCGLRLCQRSAQRGAPRRVGEPRRDAAQRRGLHQTAQFVDVVHVAQRQRRNGEAAPLADEQPFARQTRHRHAHRRARHAELLGELHFLQRRAGADRTAAQL